MTQLNFHTLQAQSMINNYLNTRKDCIFEVYEKPSAAKINAFNDIKKEMSDIGGYDIRVTTAGKNYFSVAYLLDENDEKWLIYHTASKCFKICYKLKDN